MNIKETLKKITDAVQPFYLFLTMVFFFITSIYSVSRFLSSNGADISVSVKYGSMDYPSSINTKYLSVLKSLIELSDSSRILNNANDVRIFLTQTKKVKYITIKNNRNRIISNVAFRDCTVSSLTAYGISSSFKLPEEDAYSVNDMSYNEKNSIVYFEEPITLYPHEELRIVLWGSFSLPYDQEPVFVSYDDHTAKVLSAKEFSGFSALIAEYYGVFFIVLLLIFSVVIYYTVAQKNG